MTSTPTALRGAHVQQLMTTAQEARAQFVDVVATGPMFETLDRPVVSAGEMSFGQPTQRAYNQIAGRAGVPTKFAQRLQQDHHDLYCATMNELYPAGPSLFRLRAVTGTDGDSVFAPVVRAVLSDRYQVIDNVDVLTTMLQAFIDSGLQANDVQIHGDFDADDGQLRLRCTVPSIGVHARELVKNYRSPFDKRPGSELPMMFAGIEVSNSETGGGAYTIRPRAVLQVCNNGMTRSVGDEQFRRVHLGAKLQTDGVISWSDETRRKQLELIGSAAQDAITTFISPAYLQQLVDAATAAAGIEVDRVDEAMSMVTKTAMLSDDEASSVLRNWITSADVSVLGLAHAVTATAQVVESSDRQSELEQAFWTIVDSPLMYTGS